MRGLKHIQRRWTAARARVHDQVGAAMSEYAIAVACIAMMVITGLAFLGGSLGGSFTDVVINSPLDMATYTFFDHHECFEGGWTELGTNEGVPFENQGQCVSYAVHHGG